MNKYIIYIIEIVLKKMQEKLFVLIILLLAFANLVILSYSQNEYFLPFTIMRDKIKPPTKQNNIIESELRFLKQFVVI